MGRIATKYTRRIKNVGPQTDLLKRKVAVVLKEALVAATNEELYDRTPYYTTKAMRNSIGANVLGDTAIVGYNIGRGKLAKHPQYRLQMKGVSQRGHLKDMKPSVIVARIADPKIKALNALAQKGILGD